MSELGLYLVRNTDYCAETRNLIEDTINAVNTQISTIYAKDEGAREYLVGLRMSVLRNALKSMGFSDEQLEAFARKKIPTEYQMVPVEVSVIQRYRLYIRVPVGATEDQVKESAKQQVLDGKISDKDLIPDWDVEEEDIVETSVYWDGAQNE